MSYEAEKINEAEDRLREITSKLDAALTNPDVSDDVFLELRVQAVTQLLLWNHAHQHWDDTHSMRRKAS
jgi:hypothetical protein